MQIRRLSSAEADFQKKFSELVAVDASVDPEITRRAEAIVDDVRERGDAAVLEYTARFDRLPAEKLSDLVISAEEMRQALETLPEDQRTALEEAARRIRVFHENELEKSFTVCDEYGNKLGQRVTPVDSVVGGLSYALQYLAMCVLLILALVKSGSWARDIVGG